MRVALLNVHGNITPENRYIGEHTDFGGQHVYVRELASFLSKEGVKADVITRQITDEDWPGLDEPITYFHDVPGARIIRISFGGKKLINKEKIWPHLHEYVNRIIEFYRQENNRIDFITSHYGDAGIAAAMLNKKLNIPYSFTAHSLGASKMDILNISEENISEMNRKFNFSVRLAAERISIMNSAVNISSTREERSEQYGHYAYCDTADTNDEQRFAVIPPGTNTCIFNQERIKEENEIIEYIGQIFKRDLLPARHDLPAIIAASRLDARKNHLGLLESYANSPELQKTANLVFTTQGIDNAFHGCNQDGSDTMAVLGKIIDRIIIGGLKGKVCLINLKNQQNLAVFYRHLAQKHSVFCLASFHETFGIGIIEAMACGLPVVATKNGGTAEILVEKNVKYGVPIDPSDHEEMSTALYGILSGRELWQHYHKQGIERVKDKYRWEITAKSYIQLINDKCGSVSTRGVPVHPYFYTGNESQKPSVSYLKRLYLDIKPRNFICA